MEMQDRENDVAVVGMSCRLPGARDTAEYWRNLCAGVESISFFSPGELTAAGEPPEAVHDPSYVPAHGSMPDAYAFDAAFFAVSVREARAMDPQQRVFLECAWSALEHAGCDPARFAGTIGVYGGSGSNHHLLRVLADAELAAAVGEEVAIFANARDFLTTRVSYKLGLRGPSVAVQTACSTSLVAIHLACQSLLNRECDLALAGGVTIAPDQVAGYRHLEGGILSPDGHCRAFDARAAGTVGGSGAGVVALRRFADAVRDGDTIHAVVKGSAINNDGAGKVGFTAPSVGGQARAIAEALAVAGVDASEISFVETHGTGTALGDPIEIAALAQVFGAAAAVRGGPCALGAVKTGIGHVDCAAGVAGFIKTVLSLRHRQLPPTLHFQSPNPETGLDGSPFYVNTVLRPWDADGGPRRAGVSSFGMGGTNAHAVLEEAPDPAPSPPSDAAQLLVLSAKSESALERMRSALAAHLAEHPELPLGDAAYTLQEGRAAHPHRWAAAARDAAEARAVLAGDGGRRSAPRRAADRPPPVAFLFPGQGTQHAGMARELYGREHAFREEIDRCAALLEPELGMDLRTALFPAPGGEAEANALLQQTRCTQPALFVVEHALARLWMSWGVHPAAMLGHSIGEYVAACLAGVFTLEGALRLVAARGRLMQALPGGAMLAVPLPEADVRPLLSADVSLAAVNSAAHCVVSGDPDAIAAVEALLAGRGVAARRLHTSHAFHSAAMDPVLDEFAAVVRRARPAEPSIPFLSNLTGDWITPAEATDPRYWVRHLRETVRFADGAGRLLDDPQGVLLEVGPGETLGTFARRHERGGPGRVIVASLPRADRPEPSDRTVLDAAGALWTAGVEIGWTALRGPGACRKVPLPTYPLERTEYRVPRPASTPAALPVVAAPLTADVPHSAQPMTQPVPAEPVPSPRRPARVAGRVRDIFGRLLGTEPAQLDEGSSFLDLGADSLLLMQASRTIESELGVKVPFRRLLEGLSTLRELAAHLERELPAEAPEPAEPVETAAAAELPVETAPAAAVPSTPGAVAAPAGAPAGLQEIFAEQLAIMRRQLELLGGGAVPSPAITNGRNGHHAETVAPPVPPARLERVQGSAVAATSAAPASPSAASTPAAPPSHGPHRPVSATLGLGGGYTARQAQHFARLVERYTARTRRSKEYAAENRPHLSDNRASLNFRMATKELMYPVVGERSEGSRLWDLDGNEYVDFTIGFGVHFFGHRPPFVTAAVEEQLRRGFHLGPQSDVAGPAARLLAELTGMERVTFCNTGSEAVMTALRIARAATGREKVVLFEGSYHGCFDGILARPGGGGNGAPRSRPVAPGTPQGMVDDVVLLPYGEPAALEWLAANPHDVAAVLVEPVQSRNPEFHPREFLRELRSLTARTGTVLIFDEMITGLRLEQRGAQGFYGIDADLATYGKVIGGGFALGVVAGRARYMDAIDGGPWRFGDDSYPAADQTFFAGTFCKHPVTMAAAYAVLRHLRERGPALYEELNARTARLVAALRAVIEEEGAPLRILHCASLFHFRPDPQNPFGDLLFYHMLERGIYIWEGRACFLSTAHTDADCDRLVAAFRDSIHALRDGGFLPERPGPSGGTAISVGPGTGVFPAPGDASPGSPSFPLTPAQRQIWAHAQLGDDASRAYNEQLVIGLRGRFDADALRAAAGDLMRQHQALRLVFDASGESQRAAAGLPLPFFVEPASPSDDELAAAMDRAVRAVFDLRGGPLFRVHVHARGPERHVVQMIVHHLLADGFSAPLLQRDLLAAYRARLAGRSPDLGPAMQFGEYAALLRRHAEAHAGREAEWLERFRGAAALELPADRARPRFPTHRAAGATHVLGAALAGRLRELGRREGCTLFNTLLAGVLATAHRLSGQDDVVVGIPSAGRPFPGSHTLVGDCADVLPIRSRVAGGDDARGFLKAVRGWLLDAYEDEVFAYTRLQERLQLPRGPGHPPLVSLVFNLEPRGPEAEEDEGDGTRVRVEAVGGSTPFAKFDLTIDVLDRGGEVEVIATFNSDLFEETTVERLLARLEHVLEQMAAAPDVRLDALELLGPAERARVLDEWNRTESPFPADRCLHQLFEAHADRAPDAPAAIYRDQPLGYGELDESANRLAHHLAGLGVGPEVRVGLCLERGPGLVAAILGVLKAGGAYVPLDPAYPAERLARMLEGSGAAVVVTEESLRGVLPALPGVAVVSVDGDARDAIAAASAERVPVSVEPRNLAYVIFTSGSTGEPKGIALAHRGVVNNLADLNGGWGVGPADRVLLLSSLSFDMSVYETLGILAAGGAVVIPDAAELREPARWAGLMRRHAVSVWNSAPALLGMLADHLDEHPGDAPPALRLAFLGGDWVPVPLPDRIRAHAPGMDVVVMGGATEASIHSIIFPVRATDPGWTSIPYGAPMANQRAYALDERLRPVPIGVAGELYLGGIGLARGYVGRAGFTAERFLPDPYAAAPGARMYRTGDRVRWRADGTLEMLGRLDVQVKIRGFRVELGEVEAVLRRHPGVERAVAAVRDDGAGDRRLVAWVVGTADADSLRDYLRRSLPEYMVPSAFVALDALPLSPNGKVDRRALPAPEQAAGGAHAAPRTPVEEVLAGIWAGLLDTGPIGTGDSFFALGGHSLLATRMASRVRAVFGVELPLREVFETPTLAGLAARVEALRRAELPQLPPVAPAGRDAPPPLSFAQERLWFLDRLLPASGFYNVPMALRLRGALDAAALERALGGVVRRHEVLRTTFAEGHGAPVQVIAPFAGFSLAAEDVAGMDDEALRRRAAEDGARPFDLAAGPLFRASLLRVASDDHLLLICLHHAVADGWSLGVLCRELSSLYETERAGEESRLAPLPVQYADYAVWQREHLRGEALDRQLAWWKERLAGAPALLELPTDHARPAVQSHRGAHEQAAVSGWVTGSLKALAQREGATLYMVLLGAFQVLLSRYSGRDDVVVGSPIAGRTRAEVEGLIGFFINTLVLRTDLGGDPTFREVLRRVREVTLGAYEHQDLPFEKLVEELHPERSMAHAPLFQVLFTLQNAESPGVEMPGLEVEEMGLDSATAKFDLNLTVAEGDGELRASLGYSTDLFERATALRMLEHLGRVLEQVAENADVRLSGLELVGEAERTRIVEEWNATDAACPDGACIPALFEAQVARTPAAVAASAGEEELTYAHLNARANRLAHHLAGLGVGPDVRVAVCMERGLEMVVAVLAILKAGGAYLPLDPAHPADRLRTMLEDGAPAVLLAYGVADDVVRALVAGAAVPVVRFGTDAEAWAGQPATNPVRAGLTPEHLCYVIYTSGSTGRPKGVMNPHRALVNRLVWGQRAWGIGEGDAVLCNTSLGFDVSARELFLPLISGARVVMACDDGHGDPDYLLDLVRRERITTLNVVPSLLQVLLEHPRIASCTGLTRVVCSGEALPAALLRRFRERLPETALHNVYGPSEAATATALRCGGDEAGASVRIGRPIANTRVYVLDRAGRPVPVGLVGELHVGGAGVARGYLDRPALTAGRFVPDPFASTPGARMYRTGDLGRWLEDGTIEFLGRNDFQVKVRGFRIEPGEIEAALREHPGVRDAVVLARPDASGGTRLVAYVAGGGADAQALRAHLAGRLPEYMVPAAYVRLDALPLTPNGKLDRRALPDPDGDAFATRAWEPPLGPAESAVAEVWADVLGVRRVGRNDHFFDLGGHSLRAVQVVSRIRQVLGVEAALGELFLHPVLADFARALELATRSELPAITPVARDGALRLSFAQQRLWFIDGMGGAGAAYHIPARLRLRGRVDRASLERALDRIVARHEALRTTFAQEDGEPVQRIAPAAESRFRLLDHDLAEHPRRDAELGRLMEEEAAAPFDLEHGPLIRGRLVRLGADDHVLLVTLHHIASDGWSMDLLVNELSALYRAFAAGEPDPLAPLPVQYADYAAWQRRWLEGEVLQRQSDYWKQALSGVPELLELPTDRPRPAQQDFSGAAVRLELDEELTTALRALGRRHGTTLFMTLLAGWAAVLGRLSGQTDVVVGTPAANRGQRETEGLIGFFVNTLALRVDLSGSPTVAELLRRVRARALDAQHHQDIPFERVVELVQPVRSLAHTPLFQAVFAWQNTPGGSLELPGLALEAVEDAAFVPANYDLSLALQEADGRVVGGLLYAMSLFDGATMERWLGYLRNALRAMAADAGQRVDALPLLPEAERRMVVEAWNRTDRPYPRESCIHELFQAQVRARPDAVALAWGGETLSYRELDECANRLAHHLIRLGVGPESRVGVLLERGIDLIVSLLAVMQSGGCYVPLDPTYPPGRLRWMLADSAARVLLTRGDLAGTIALDELHVVRLDAVRELLAEMPAGAPVNRTAPENLAYIVYTSGSTGRPKGVMVAHREVVQLVVETDFVRLQPGDRVAQASNASFDALTFEAWGALLNGATLVGIAKEEMLSPAAFRCVLRDEGITTLYQTTALLNQHSREEPDIFAPLREVLFGGQAVDADSVRRLLRGGKPRRLLHVYGPTEVTAWCSYEQVERVDEDALTVSVGRPIANARIYVLDGSLAPTPAGVPAEAYVGGDGVVRGYLDRPALTAERFIPDPFALRPGARMYRTGDRMRWKVDGTLEFIGRLDEQVKIRGFRIEPGEVESVLSAHAGVREARVVVRADEPGEPRLVAYVVGNANADALRAHLRRSLPEYMLPAALVALDRLPLTPSGKLDRAALPAPELPAGDEYVAPRTPVEEALAALWAEVLRVDRVGVKDDFFLLGGHSLLIMRLLSSVKAAFGVEVSIRTVFSSPTLEAMAAEIERRVYDDILEMSDAQAEQLAAHQTAEA